jgi:hypothetical protein
MRALALVPLAVATALPLAVSTALPLPVRAAGPWKSDKPGATRKATADGRAETPDGVVPAILKIACRGGDDGSVCVALKVEDTPQVPSFDFAAFEGPDAKAAALPLFSAHTASASVSGAIGGRVAADPPGAFLFEFCGPSRGASDAKRLAHAIAAGPGEVELAIEDPARDGRAIRARFPADAPKGEVAATLRACPEAAPGAP